MNLKQEFEFLKYCFSRRKDSRFIKNVMSLSGDHSLVHMQKMGGTKDTGILYYIKMEPSYSGFFADHNRLLTLLYYADYYGMKPVVEYGEEYTYREEHPVNGTNNPFEYYFEQPCGIGPGQLKEYKGVICSRKENVALAGIKHSGRGGSYGIPEEYLDALAKVSKRFIRLNSTVGSMIEKSVLEIKQGKRTLGVHVRGTDFKRNYNGHPICIETSEYLEEAKRVFSQKQYERVFLATDDLQAVGLFQAEFGDRLAYYDDVYRSDGKETVMKSEATRENHHYLLGLEVLRDMMTLAECDGLVAGLSQVSYSARIQKKSQGKEYDDLVILFKGINEHGENCVH